MTREKNRTRGTTETSGSEQKSQGAANMATQEQASGLQAAAPENSEVDLKTILGEIQSFRRESNQQLEEIKGELNKTNQRIQQAEDRIEDVETRVQNMEEVIRKMIKLQSQHEKKMVDLEGRSRRDNIRIYNVPEHAEGESVSNFVKQLLVDELGIPPADLGIERAHRALAPQPAENNKPRSIVVKFSTFRMKEETIRKAWAKKQIHVNGQRIYFDHDYPSEVLRKRKEYTEVKRALKDKQIRFQTPYPARLRVFYEDGAHLYHTAEEATKGLEARGFQVKKTSATESLAEQLDRHAWDCAPKQHGEKAAKMPDFKERLRAFRR